LPCKKAQFVFLSLLTSFASALCFVYLVSLVSLVQKIALKKGFALKKGSLVQKILKKTPPFRYGMN